MRPQIFIPTEHVQGDSPEKQLAHVGLNHLKGVNTHEGPGPDGGRGVFYTWVDSSSIAIGYDKPNQTWFPSFKRGDAQAGLYWTGIHKDKPPTESDLRRPDSRSGKFVPMSNGESYLITTPATLDRFPSRDDDGRLVWLVDDSFNWLVQDLEHRKATGITLGEKEDDKTVLITFDDESDFGFLLKLLQINYRMTEELLIHLKLLNQQAIRDIVIVLMGLSPVSSEG